MDAQTYMFDSTAELRMARLFGVPGLRTPMIRFSPDRAP
jgi:hypothetical protein